ncbi:N-acetylneuraminate synthase family protein [uncultured Psychrobacter sp.]|jgi:N-acetylneuraminate synthase|uniref:N-acetylneuraminate synthase family protein n=1 Tax=uncultured Psychrobacter sp. TaxID=259303 RepID=UPI00261DAA73|nr:N-acetylneuraminate synthase family protein [uncultured Psychrobacter sp.]
MSNLIDINGRKIGAGHPAYFIADIGANHDGDIEHAKDLIHLCAEAGANAAKFQHFTADSIVSDQGFKSIGSQISHQKKWKKSVFDVYSDASINLEWTETLKETCEKAGVDFFTSAYSFDLVDYIDPYVPAYKVGSGDITWTEMIEYVAQKQKPYIIASGASTMDDVVRAVSAGLAINDQLCLMQCNTNYTASLENFKFIQLNVLRVFKEMYPDMVLGLSDHTPGHATVLGALTLGASMIEKHFTDDNSLEGPDHKFSMNPKSWKEMVDASRELENALGNGIKKIENNENQTAIVQRRSIRVVDDVSAGSTITKDQLTVLRPCPEDGLAPYHMDDILGKTVNKDIKAGEHIRWIDLT